MQRFKEIRQKANLTQANLAECLGIKQSAVSAWECSISRPNIENIQKLAKVLNCDFETVAKCFIKEEK